MADKKDEDKKTKTSREDIDQEIDDVVRDLNRFFCL